MDEPDLKVLLLAGRFEVRGSSAYTLRLAENLPQNGVAVRVACTNAAAIDPTRRGKLDVREYPNLRTPILNRLARSLVHHDHADWSPDLIHIQSRALISVGKWLAEQFGCPYVVTIHDILPHNDRIRFQPDRERRIIAVSEPVKTVLCDRLGLGDDDVTVIHGGVETDRGRELPRVLDPDHRSVIGVAGPLEIIKGLPYFLGAAQRVLESRKDVEFLVSGAGPEEESLRRLASELGIATSVTFVPNLADFDEPLAAMDIFCLPSLQQGLGAIMLEAMALGKPVIASGVGGVFTIIRDNETGLVVPPSNSERLAERMLELLADPVLARSIGEAGRRLVQREFNTEQMVNFTVELYREMIAARQTHPTTTAGKTG